MDRLDELQVFLAIVDEGSLAGAARKLQRSAPAVTRTLARLEEQIGVRLVERTTRRLAPTDAGRRLADHARRLLGDFEEAMRDVAGDMAMPRGTLRVTAPLMFGRMHVLPCVTGFLDEHPAVEVDLLLSDRNLDLIDEGLDVAVRIGTLAESGLIARRIGQVRRVLVASPAYLERRGTPRDPAELAGHDIIHFASRPQPREWRFRTPEGERTVRISPRLTVSQGDAALWAAREGRGITAALSYQVAEDVASGRLVRLLRSFDPAVRPVHLVFPSARLMPPRVRAFLDYATRRLSVLPVLNEEV
ncbi:LysR family transcriptional regulator [Azospirillum thermophilum]|uniref:Transcriptional regulator n=1 Tax=Azospirillum thermophilum TaxID=2202148 RepID=A0A2S2CLT1_9PROT|nr:LysR family transcriptional regulator [Azospirillum thermophilum]AWK85478.1 transcriptional regulator [Azospirillum thermophilum]